jgi:uncharacterized protein
MTAWKVQLEDLFVRLSRRVMTHPKLLMLLFALTLVGVGQNLRFMELDPELEHFVDPAAQVRVIYNQTKEEFGRNDMVMLALRGDVLSTDFLTDLNDLQNRIETELDYVDDVTSLINAPYQQGSDDTLEVLDLVDELPQNETDLEAIDQRIKHSTLASSILVNDARDITVMMIEPATYDYGETAEVDPLAVDFDAAFDEDPFSALNDSAPEEALPLINSFQIKAMLDQLNGILDDYPQLNPLLAGIPPLDASLEETMRTEMMFFLRLTVLLIAVTLIAFFRQLNAVVAPMLAVLSALILTMSVLVITGNKIQVPLILLPSFLLAITIGDAVHLLTHFYHQLRSGDTRIDAMAHAIKRTSIPMLLTSLTTAGGLLSLSIADVVPVRNLGIYAALGVMLAFVLTMVVIPALIMLLPMRKVARSDEHSQLNTLIWKLGEFSWQYGGRIASLWLLAVLLSVITIVQLRFSHDPLNWMPENLDIVESTRIIDKELSGTMTLEIVFDTGEVDGAKNLTLLNAIADWQDKLEGYKSDRVEVKGVNSIIDLVRESNRALQGGGDDQFRLPQTQELLNHELFLFENSASDELYQLVNNNFSKTKMTLVLPWEDLMYYAGFVRDIESEVQSRFAGMADVQVTGMMALMSSTLAKLMTDTAYSYLLAFIVIAIMMMLLLNSIGLGLLAMIPNIAPIVVVMGIMKPMGIPLDMLTMLVATIAIGIAVDNTVHFTHHFRHGLDLGHSVHAAMQDAFRGAGQALFTTCIVLTIGFYVFLFSEVRSIFNLGFLCGTAFLLAMISNFTLTPYLLRWYYRRHPSLQGV